MFVSRVVTEIKRKQGTALIVGLGVSGVASACFLAGRKIPVRVADQQRREALVSSKAKAGLLSVESLGCECHYGVRGDERELYDGVSFAVLSPGIASDSAFASELRVRDIPWCCELELGAVLRGGRQIVVTGSNGKSTTVSLIHACLNVAGVKADLAGNIGTPLVSLLETPSPRVTVIEASSYQLESVTALHPTTAVLLNLSENHLARHGSIEAYAAAKARIFQGQTGDDLAILNGDDPFVARMAVSASAEVQVFGRASNPDRPPGAYIRYDPVKGIDCIELRTRGGVDQRIETAGAKLLGEHNRLNMAVALLAVLREGVSAARAREVLLEMRPLPHRIEVLGNRGNVTWINDSKATTVAAAVAGLTCVLQAMPAAKVVVLLGGEDKGGSWKAVESVLVAQRSRIRAVICFGGSGQLIQKALAPSVSSECAKDLRDAVALAGRRAQSHDTVLLSPGCASFDEFEDFEHRGRVFGELVAER